MQFNFVVFYPFKETAIIRLTSDVNIEKVHPSLSVVAGEGIYVVVTGMMCMIVEDLNMMQDGKAELSLLNLIDIMSVIDHILREVTLLVCDLTISATCI